MFFYPVSHSLKQRTVAAVFIALIGLVFLACYQLALVFPVSIVPILKIEKHTFSNLNLVEQTDPLTTNLSTTKKNNKKK